MTYGSFSHNGDIMQQLAVEYTFKNYSGIRTSVVGRKHMPAYKSRLPFLSIVHSSLHFYKGHTISSNYTPIFLEPYEEAYI